MASRGVVAQCLQLQYLSTRWMSRITSAVDCAQCTASTAILSPAACASVTSMPSNSAMTSHSAQAATAPLAVGTLKSREAGWASWWQFIWMLRRNFYESIQCLKVLRTCSRILKIVVVVTITSYLSPRLSKKTPNLRISTLRMRVASEHERRIGFNL